jgi:serine/threonine protein phosphatase PrpC
MGSACAKVSDGGDAQGAGGQAEPQPTKQDSNATADASSSSEGESGKSPEGGGKHKTFRERRLSVSQTRDPNAKGAARNRRLSVYGSGGGAIEAPEVSSPLTSCGCQSIAGMEPVPGGSTAKINQDRPIAIFPFGEDAATGLFGVFDGHGRVGEKVSQYVIDTLPGTLLANEAFKAKDYGKAMKEAFVDVDRTLADHVDAGVSGTTAVSCIIQANHLWIANSGDSRAIIARQKKNSMALMAIDLSVDQKPDTPAEMKRILQMGGHVTPAGSNGSPSRVWHNLRGLAMARSIGDHHAATVGVIAEPEITEYELTDDDVALIIASDGVWELLSSQSVADIVASVKSLDPAEICRQIIDQSSYMWKIEEGDYRDDITVVVLTFPWLESYGDE